MKNNKKLAIAGASALGLAVVGFGAFAFLVTVQSKIQMVQ